MKTARYWIVFSLLLGAVSTTVNAQEPSRAQAALDESARSGKLAFIVFYKEDNPATRKMMETVNAGVKKREAKALGATVVASSPAEQTVVERFKLSRAPMPLTLAVAPNGAVTGSRELVLTALKQCQIEGRTVVMVTHDPVAASRATRTLQLRGGELLSVKSAETAAA